MENILVRIKLRYEQGGEIAYFSSKEVLDTFELQVNEHESSETFFNVGDTINLNGNRLIVKKINTKFFNKLYSPSNYGINTLGIGEDGPFNFQITYLVDDYNE